MPRCGDAWPRQHTELLDAVTALDGDSRTELERLTRQVESLSRRAARLGGADRL